MTVFLKIIVEIVGANWFDVGEDKRETLWKILEGASAGGIAIIEGVGGGCGRVGGGKENCRSQEQ